jgi:hypothetical protein
MQVSNDSADAGPAAPKPVDRVTPPTRLSVIEAAAEFERWLEHAQAAAETMPAGEAANEPASGSAADEAQPVGGGSSQSDDGGGEGSFDDNDTELDPRFSPPAWAAQSFGTATPAQDAAALQQAQHTPGPQAWAEIAAHIDRMLITDPAGRPDGAAALFRLAPELLRETTVALSRNAHGWLLRIDSQDERLRVDSTRHEAALRERFAQRGLGELVIEEGELPFLAG